MFVSQSQGFMKITNCSDGFITRTEHNLKMMQNHHRNNLKKMKRFRSAFTTEQVNYLEEQFKKFPYIPNTQRKEVAVALNIPERAVKIWFQNRRMKEKRENVNKEFVEDENEQTSNDFAKGQLNNVMVSSANDQQPQSLPVLTNIDNASESKNVVTRSASNNLNPTKANIPETKDNELMSGFKRKGSLLTTGTSLVPPITKEYAELSMNLCQKYKMGAFNNCNSTPLDMKTKDIKLDIENKPTINLNITEQIIPEDLSSRKVAASESNPSQVPSIAVSNPGYISMLPAVSPFYSEPYYSASGVFWKPVNVIPSVPSGASVSVHIPNNVPNMPIVPQTVPRKCCKCDCHSEPLLSYNIQQQSSTPQHIITAVPFSNSNAAKL